MSDDIVARLRAYVIGDQIHHPFICSEAADEIERLRAELEKWKRAAGAAGERAKENVRLRVAISYLERQEAILIQFMKDHPGLTRDEALKALEAEGF